MTQWGLDTLFNPAKRHMDEEKRRLQSTREQMGDSSGGKRIDLESGKVTMRRPAGDEDPSEQAAAAEVGEGTRPGDNAARDGAARGDDAEGDDAPQLSPAAIRAARRRGRHPR